MDDESVYTFIYKTVKAYYQFEEYIDEKLQQYNNKFQIMQGYLIDKNYYDYWKKFSNYDEIKNKITKKDYYEAKNIIIQYRRNNRYRKYQPDATQYIFYSPEDLHKALNHKKKSFVLIDHFFWQLICTEKGLREKGGMYYSIGKNCITFDFNENGNCQIYTYDNIIDSSKELEINNNSNNNFNHNHNYTMNSAYDNKKELELRKVILLYAFEQEMKKKINNLKYIEKNFQNYYLISKEWINEFKKFYHYEEISNMIQRKAGLKDLIKNGFDEAKKNMNLILNKIKFNKINLKTNFPEMLKQNNTFLTEKAQIQINGKDINYWRNFEIVSSELKDLLSSSEFHDYSFQNASDVKCLISSGKVIIDVSEDSNDDENVLEIGVISNDDMLFNDEFIFIYDNENVKDENLNYFKKDFLKFQNEYLNFGIDLECELLSNDGNNCGTAFKIPPHD